MRAIAFAVALAVGCGASEAAREAARSPSNDGTVVPHVAMPPPAAEELDGSVTSWNVGDAAVAAPSHAPMPEPAFGATESVKPGDAHAFRLGVALRAARASRSGAKVLRMLSLLPAVQDAKARTGIEPFSDGEWLLVYGAKVAVPGPNANVVKHTKAEPEVTRTMADGGFEAWDAGAATPSRNALRAEIYGVNDVLLRPQIGLVALVPSDRASDLAIALAKPIDSGARPGELARAFLAEPAKVLRFLPAEVVRATVIVKSASDGGLDASADADCPDAAQCTATATALDELARTQNSLMVRFVTKNLLGGLTVRADGAKLKATLHAGADQIDAVLNLMRSELGLPP